VTGQIAPAEGSNTARAGMVRRTPLLGAASQVIYGLSNFALFAVISALGSADVLGAASLVYLQALLWMALARAITSEPLLLLPDLLDRRREGSMNGAVAVAVWAALAAGGLTGLAVLVPSLRVGVPMAFAVAVPAAVMHDFGRGVLLAERLPQRALQGDALWLVVQVIFTGLLAAAGALTVATAVLAWGAGALVSSSFNLLPSHIRPTSTDAGRFLAEVRGLVPALAGASTVTFVSRNVTYYLIGFVGGVVVLGDLRRSLLVYAPLTALYLGVTASLVPWLARHRTDTGRQVLRLSLAFAGFSALWAIAATALTSAGIPWVSDVIGDDSAVTALLGAALVAQGVATSAVTGLRVLGRPHLQTTVVSASLVVMGLLAIVFTSSGGAKGGAAALAVGNSLEAVLGMSAFMWIRRRDRR
jgi:hypothetical protein